MPQGEGIVETPGWGKGEQQQNKEKCKREHYGTDAQMGTTFNRITLIIQASVH